MGFLSNRGSQEETEAQRMTFTKRMMVVLLLVGLADIQLSYILALLGRDPVIELSIAIVTEIIGVSIAYIVKSYFGKKEEERVRFERDLIDRKDRLRGYLGEDVEEDEGVAE